MCLHIKDMYLQSGDIDIAPESVISERRSCRFITPRKMSLRETYFVDYLAALQTDPCAETAFAFRKFNDTGTVSSRYVMVHCLSSGKAAVAEKHPVPVHHIVILMVMAHIGSHHVTGFDLAVFVDDPQQLGSVVGLSASLCFLLALM